MPLARSAMFLAALVAVLSTRVSAAPQPEVRELKMKPADDAAVVKRAELDEKAKLQLDRKLPELNFDAVGLADVIDFLRDVSGADLFVNWQALQRAGVDRRAPVSARLRNVSLSKALSVILESVGNGTLGYSVDGGVITIATGDDLAPNIVTTVYDVRDLLGPGAAADKAARGKREAALLQLVTGTVDPDSWRTEGPGGPRAGVPGAVRLLSGQLIVTQSRRNHEALMNLLVQTRRLLTSQPAGGAGE